MKFSTRSFHILTYKLKAKTICLTSFHKLLKRKKDTDEISDILFLEEIEFVCLSETKFLEFVSSFDFNEMSDQLWQNLCQCFFPHPVKKCQRKLKKKREWNVESIIVGGYDEYNGLDEKPNNENEDGDSIIFPPMKLSIDPFSLLSYSTYCNHTVLVMSDGSLKGIGDNTNGRISSTLQKKIIDDFTDFSIKDGSDRQLAAVSAV